MNLWYLTLIFPAIAVVNGWRTLRRATESPAPIPLQFSLVELMAVSFAASFWFTIESARIHPYPAACRAILCFCALLAAHDAAPKGPLLRKALFFVLFCVTFAATQGLAMFFWWAWLLFKKSDETLSRAGAYIVVAVGIVYAVSFALPLYIPSPMQQSDMLWGYMCFIGAFAESVSDVVEKFVRVDGMHVYGSGSEGMKFQILWSANVLLWIAWLYAARRKFVAAVCVSLFAVAFAAEIYFGEEANEMNMAFEFFPAYHAWMFSMLLTAILALVTVLRARSQTS